MSTDTATVTGKKYSWIMILKVIIFCWCITWIMNTGAYSTVAFNHWFSKFIGLAHDAVAYCVNCLQSI